MKISRVTMGAIIGLVAAQLPAGAAQAQTTAAGADQLAEVVITSERRESDVQKTATSVSVRSGAELQEQGRYTLAQIIEDVAGITGGAAASPIPGGSGVDTSAPGLTIRGIKSNVAAVGNVTSVAAAAAVYVDGVYEGLGGGYDIDRVEVVRGPQGTLYGRSATSGLMAIHTTDPQLNAFGGDATAEVGNYNLQHYTGVVNAPLVDNVFGIRVAGNYYKHDGYFVPRGDGSVKSTDAKVKMLFKPNDDFSLLLGYALQNNDTGNGGITLALNPGQPNTSCFETNTCAATPLGTGTNKFRQYWGLLEWNLGFAKLTYQPSVRTWESAANSSTSGPGLTISSVINIPRDRFHTEEVRLSSNPDSKLIWQVGAAYYNNSLTSHTTTDVTLALPPPPIGPGPLTSRPLDAFVRDKTTTATGVFAEGTYPVADSWRATAGIRYDHTKVAVVEDYKAQQTLPPLLISGGTLSGDAGVRSFDNVTYKARLEHDLTAENLLYASVSTGFSPGDVTIVADQNSVPQPLALKAETLVAYEIGSKNRFLDNRVQANGSVYYYHYGAYQNANVNIVEPPNQGVANITLAAPMRVLGAELETIYQLTRNDRATVNLAYSGARFSGKSQPIALASGGTTTFGRYFSQDKVPGVTPFSASLSYDHIFRLPGDSTLTLHGAARYSSAHDLTNVPVYFLAYADYVRVDGQWIEDLSATWAAGGGHFSVTGYVRNIGDNQYKSTAFIQNGLSGVAVVSTPYDPRTYGAVLNVHF